MSMRIHTTRASVVGLAVLDTHELVALYGEQFGDVDRSLVIEDAGNCEALVLMGTDVDLKALAVSIAQLVERRTARPGGRAP